MVIVQNGDREEELEEKEKEKDYGMLQHLHRLRPLQQEPQSLD
jgi:hypothetical protein